jgi:hypothetical protein
MTGGKMNDLELIGNLAEILAEVADRVREWYASEAEVEQASIMQDLYEDDDLLDFAAEAVLALLLRGDE